MTDVPKIAGSVVERAPIVNAADVLMKSGLDRDPKHDVPPRSAGLRVILILAILTGVFFIVFVGFALLTYPYPAWVAPILSGLKAKEQADILASMRSDWVQQTISLGQLFVFGSMIPLISATIGYVLGARAAGTSDS